MRPRDAGQRFRCDEKGAPRAGRRGPEQGRDAGAPAAFGEAAHALLPSLPFPAPRVPRWRAGSSATPSPGRGMGAARSASTGPAPARECLPPRARRAPAAPGPGGCGGAARPRPQCGYDLGAARPGPVAAPRGCQGAAQAAGRRMRASAFRIRPRMPRPRGARQAFPARFARRRQAGSHLPFFARQAWQAQFRPRATPLWERCRAASP